MYQTFIFDLYGTLVDIRTYEETPRLWKKMSEIYASMGASYKPAELKRELRRLQAIQEEEVFQKWGGALSKAEVEPDLTTVFAQLYEQKGCPVEEGVARMTALTFRVLSRRMIKVYDGVKETLTALREKGKKIYLLSNAQRDFTRPELTMLGLVPYFDGILISSEEGCKKPSPQFYQTLLQRYGLQAKDCLMVGNDEFSDIAGAIRLGMDSLYMHTEISPQLEEKSKATYCVMEGGFRKAAEILLQVAQSDR